MNRTIQSSLALILLLVGVAPRAWGQGLTTVTGTLTDPQGLPMRYGSIKFVLISPGGPAPTLNGLPITGIVGPTGLDFNGGFTLNLADNNVVLPAGTAWRATICPIVGQTCIEFTFPAGGQAGTITGASMNLTATLNALLLKQVSQYPVPYPGGGAGGGGPFFVNAGSCAASSGVPAGWVCSGPYPGGSKVKIIQQNRCYTNASLTANQTVIFSCKFQNTVKAGDGLIAFLNISGINEPAVFTDDAGSTFSTTQFASGRNEIGVSLSAAQTSPITITATFVDNQSGVRPGFLWILETTNNLGGVDCGVTIDGVTTSASCTTTHANDLSLLTTTESQNVTSDAQMLAATASSTQTTPVNYNLLELDSGDPVGGSAQFYSSTGGAGAYTFTFSCIVPGNFNICDKTVGNFFDSGSVPNALPSFKPLTLAMASAFLAENQNLGLPIVLYRAQILGGTASVAATTMTSPSADAEYYFSAYLDIRAIGSACTGTTTIVLNAITTDFFGGTVTTALATFSISGNGTLGQHLNTSAFFLHSLAANPVQFSTTYTAGTGCAPGPSVDIYPLLTEVF